MTQARTLSATAVRWLMLLALITSSVSFAMPGAFATPAALAAPAAAPTNVVRLRVFDATSPATTITTYQYLINEDNTGNTRDAAADCRPTDPGLTDPTLANCDWPSIHKMPGNAPIVTQGDQGDFAVGLDLAPYLALHPNATKFLISVVADGYKVGGRHFSLPLDDANNLVEVELEPNPLPTLTFRAMVFNDNTSPNGAMDTPGENGLNGFEGHLADVLGEISTDWFGNPLCTEYERDGAGNVILDADGAPTPLPGTGGICLSGDRNHDGVISPEEDDPAQNPDYGQVVIPNLGSNRFAASVIPPNGSNWVQTTSLEGYHDWDTWLMEGATGYDTEFLYQNELFPWAWFGFVEPTFRQIDDTTTSFAGNATYPGEVRGTAWAVKIFVPPQGGLSVINRGIMGGKRDYPVDRPYVALSDLNNGDQMVYMGRGNPDGTFRITNVPPGDYFVTVWDGPQILILDGLQTLITVTDTVTYVGDTWPGLNPGDPDVPGNVPLLGWFTRFEGSVFIDTNVNGKRDPGEKGLPQQFVALKMRGNSLVQHGQTGVLTDADGRYVLRRAYPFNTWIVMEVYNDLYYTTGVTYQADNQPTETTIMGQGVDINVLPIIGLSGRLDWGVLPYKRTENGGIVGSISYDVTRNELDPRLAAAEDWQPGVPNIDVNLYPAVACTNPATQSCDASGQYQVAADGSFLKGNGGVPLQTYLSESWERPAGCVARDVDGNPVAQQALSSDPAAECVEAPMLGVQFGPMPDDPLAPTNFGATVDGNFGFGDIPAGDYLVEVAIPTDPWGKPLYKVTREEDINVFNGDTYVPQVPPPPCAGALHIVDVADVGTDGLTATVNPNFAAEGGSPYEGQSRHLCDVKLVRLQNGRSIAPGFNLFTDVPLPARFNGLTVDNLNLSIDPKSVMFGEVAGIPHLPVGIYDFNGRLLHTIESDPNGIWEVLMPSSLQINCPTPAGVCPNMFRFVGNDPGQPFRRNPNWNPQYQTISANFEGWPGVINPADLAPMPIAATVQNPGNEFNALATCALPSTTPRLFVVDRPYVIGSGAIEIRGDAFGAVQGAGTVTLDGTPIAVNSWSNNVIAVTVPAGFPVGPHQLHITTGSGATLINGLTVHVLSSLPAFPANGILDAFTRGDTSNGFGASWADDAPSSVFNTIANQARVRTGGPAYDAWWTANSFSANQEAYFTFVQVSSAGSTDEQGLLLKFTGATPNAAAARWIEVAYDRDTSGAAGLQPGVLIRAKLSGSDPATLLTLPASFAATDQLGARALSDGTIVAYKNGAELGRMNVAETAAWTGRIGVRFEGTGTAAGTQARFDGFGGGSLSLGALYAPAVIEVGPGRAFDPTITTLDLITGLPYEHALQNALDAAAALGNALVVVYPNTPVPNFNPQGVYFENIVLHSSVKLQGVGPGGHFTDTNNLVQFVGGSIIDGIGYSPDATPSADWYALVASLLTADPAGGDPIAIGNPNISDGEVIYVLPTSTTQFGSAFKSAIDGFDIRGGDQLGFPDNINGLGGGQANGGRPTFQGDVPTQGGGIYVHGYARHLQITNNVLQSNGGAYGGAIRVGTPGIDNHNDNLRIANNRFLANGGTNLAGAIGLFRGSDNYEVAHNDLCGNFSAEYGGAISHFGYSPNGQIHDNRIYWNQAVDEAGGIMIGGELPSDPLANYGTANGPQGAGAVAVYNNLIQSNIAGDDGGGLRFLMAGNFPYNVYNNLIVNNLSAHEGGGVALDDASNVRFYHNTVMKNLSTDTAATATFNTPSPAGLSTSANSAQLQATLPGGSPAFSNPVLFNNVFWDNRAGSYNAGTAQISGIGLAGAGDINQWDMGSTNPIVQLSPTTSILQQNNPGTDGLFHSSNNYGGDPGVAGAYDTSVRVYPWRSPNQVAPVIVAVDVLGVLPGNYHLADGSPAVDLGAVSKAGVNAPAFDIDREGRPAGAQCLPDSGADEIQTGGTCADLSITQTNNVSTILAGSIVNYTIVVANSGPNAISGAPVTANFPAALTVNTWTCDASTDGACSVSGSGNNRTGTVTLPVGGSATFSAQTTLAASATGTLVNTASVAASGGAIDPNMANNSATDTDSIVPALPALPQLDTFTRSAATTLGSNWSQVTLAVLGAAIRVNSSQAQAAMAGAAYWNVPSAGFGTKQGAAFTFAATPGGLLVPNTLVLKASGGSATTPANYISVGYASAINRVLVSTTSGGSVTLRALFPATLANGDTLSAVADATGRVYVYKTASGVTTFVGQTSIPGAGFWTGTGRIGLQLPIGARVDNFSGGTLP